MGISRQININEQDLRLQAQTLDGALLEWNVKTQQLRVNEQFGKFFGKTGNGKNGLEFLIGLLHPDDYRKLIDETGTARNVRKNLLNSKLRLKTTNGYRFFESQSYLGWDEDGELEKLVVVLANIDERNEQELAYQALLLQNVPDAIISTDLDYRIKSWNKAAENIYGWKAEEVIGFDLHKVLDTRFPEGNGLAALDTEYPADDSWCRELIQSHQDGHSINILSSIVRLQDNNQSQPGYVIANRNISQEKRREEHFRQSETELRALFQAMTDFIAVIDRQGNILKVAPTNPIRVFPSVGDIVNRNVSEIVEPELAANFRADINKSLANKETVIAEYLVVYQGVEHWVNCAISPLDNDDVIAVVRDITEKRQAETDLRESEERFKTLFDLTPEPLCLIDPNLRVINVNKAVENLTGYQRNQLLNRNIAELEILDQGRMASLVKNVKFQPEKKYEAKPVELTINSANGESHIAEAYIQPITINGEVYFLCAIRDISKHKQLETDLREAYEKQLELNELKTKFVSMVSHEFRTPLSIIQAASDALYSYMTKMSSDQVKRRLDKIQDQIHHMVALLNDVLVLGQIKSGKINIYPSKVDFIELCDIVFNEAKDIDQGHHQFTYLKPTQAVDIIIDTKLIGQAMNNLLSNALKYSPDKSKIIFEIIEDPDTIKIRITDQGKGIPETDQEHLFDPFYRGSNAINIPGTGLGLAITRHAVEIHHGSVQFSSTKNEGTTFIVRLPKEQRIDLLRQEDSANDQNFSN